MANAETTFADRHGRAETMQSTIAAFVPVFAPSDVSLLPAAFDAFLTTVNTANVAVSTAEAEATNDVMLRAGLLKSIKERTTQIVGYVKSNKAWKNYLPAVKKAADKVRGYHPPKAKPAPPPPGSTPPPAVPKRNQGEQSYADAEGLFCKVIEAVKKVPGYAPTADSNIQIAQIESLLNGFGSANRDVGVSDVALTNKQVARLKLYDGPDGLREKMLAIKEAAKGQYGGQSAQYLSVKSIRV